MKLFDSRLIARYIIYRANQLDKYMNFTKTHKLLYMLDGMVLFLHNKKFFNESPQAWEYGPAYPKVQEMLKSLPPKDLGYPEKGFIEIEKEKDIVFLTTRVLDRFGNCTSKELADWSHKKGSPWWITRQKHRKDYAVCIDICTITDYFSIVFGRETVVIMDI